jgi:DNA-binding IclR family transcriptional regulator
MTKATTEDEGTSKNSSYLSRVATLLRFLADHADTGARVPEICKRLEMHRVSVHRLLKALMEIGFIEQAPDLSYHLGFEAWSLGMAAQRFIPASFAAALKRISDATSECVFLMRKTGDEGICIACHEGSSPVRSTVMRVGTRRFLGVGGTSVAILAGLPEGEANEIIERNAEAYRAFGISKLDVRRFVVDARARGYAYSHGVVVPESRTLAVPLTPSENTSSVMSMSIVTLESRLREPKRDELVELLKQEAAALGSLEARPLR